MCSQWKIQVGEAGDLRALMPDLAWECGPKAQPPGVTSDFETPDLAVGVPKRSPELVPRREAEALVQHEFQLCELRLD